MFGRVRMKKIFKNNFVYLILNKTNHKKYIGVKSCDEDPKDVIGKKYFSSSSDKNFIKEQKEFPERFKYRVLKNFKTREEALNLEIYLHEAYNVDKSEEFYNLSKQTSIKFSFSESQGLTGEKNGMYGKKRTKEEKEKISKAVKNALKNFKKYFSERSKKFWEEHPELKEVYSKNASEQFKKLWQNEEYKEKMKKRDEKNRKHLQELARKNFLEGKGCYKKIKCPYCGKEVQAGVYGRLHGEKCKEKGTA